jgi:5-methylcytosine-specific restriction protein A
MPYRSKIPCKHVGCAVLLDAPGYCAAHQRAEKVREREYDDARGNSHQRGYTRHWRTTARAFLMNHPLCVMCAEKGLVTAAREVDHIKPHRGDPEKFWDLSNLQPLCSACHSSKTSYEIHERRKASANPAVHSVRSKSW